MRSDKRREFLETAYAHDWIDEREIFFQGELIASNGNNGMVFGLLNGSLLRFFKIAHDERCGMQIDQVDLRNAKILSSFALGSSVMLNLEVGEDTYRLHGTARAAKMVKAVRSGCGVK